MTSSHQSPGNGEVTGAWAVGGGPVENVTVEGQTVGKVFATDQTLIQRELHGVDKIFKTLYLTIKQSLVFGGASVLLLTTVI